jgi:clan AA aspartic protease (TIGR02281 family)
MAEAVLAPRGPLIIYAELVGPRTSRVISMVLDTGAVQTMIPIETALAIGYDPVAAKHRVEVVTASGVERVPTLTVKAIHCLGLTVINVDVICHDLPTQSPVKGLLGLNFLRHFNVHLNFLFDRLELLKDGRF